MINIVDIQNQRCYNTKEFVSIIRTMCRPQNRLHFVSILCERFYTADIGSFE